jgi:transposase
VRDLPLAEGFARAWPGGLRALASSRGTGRPRKLTPAQKRQVLRWIDGKNPLQYGFDFALWTRRIVGELIAQRFGVSLSLASVGVLLARQELTAQKPLERAYQRDPEAIERWQRETYPGALNGELFVVLLKKLMYRRRKPLHLVLDSLPTHKTRVLKAYVAATRDKLTVHYLPGYAPELNPDELV